MIALVFTKSISIETVGVGALVRYGNNRFPYKLATIHLKELCHKDSFLHASAVAFLGESRI